MLDRNRRPRHAEEYELAGVLQVEADLGHVSGDQQLIVPIDKAANAIIIFVEQIDQVRRRRRVAVAVNGKR